jgi:hypothetical protein
MFSWGSVSLESFGTCCLLENINIQLSRLEKYKAKQIINKINGRKPPQIGCLVSDWLMTFKQASPLAAGSYLKYCSGPAVILLIFFRAKCKHIPDDLWRWQANIVTTIFEYARQK